MITLRLWDLFENVALWSSDMPHLDASDVWEAIDHMDKYQVPQSAREKMLGGNARRLYGIEPELFVTRAPDEYKPQTIRGMRKRLRHWFHLPGSILLAPPYIRQPGMSGSLSFVELLDEARGFDFSHQAWVDKLPRIGAGGFRFARCDVVEQSFHAVWSRQQLSGKAAV